MPEPPATPSLKALRRKPKQARREPTQAGHRHRSASEVASQMLENSAQVSPEQSQQQPQPATPARSSSTRKRQPRNINNTNRRTPKHEYNSDSGVAPSKDYSPSRSVSHSMDMSSGIGGYEGPGLSRPIGNSANNSYRRTPPNVRTPAKQVYAGPIFLASPAASSLPMPRAFSKSVPSVALRDQTPPLPEKENKTEEQLTPAPVQAAPPGRDQSPLDLFFNADRAERSRQGLRTDSPLSAIRPNPGIHDNDGRSHSLPQAALPRASTAKPINGSPGKGIFTMDMDDPGSDEVPPSMPYQQRMNAVRQSAPSKANARPTSQDDDLQRQAKTRALKQMLMIPQDESTQTHDRSIAPTTNSKSEASTELDERQNQGSSKVDVRMMEDHLRKILKLGP